MNSLLQRAKRSLRGPYRTARRRYARWLHAFGEPELIKLLADVGVRRGDAVLLHSGMDGFAGFDGSIADLIRIFKQTVGDDGVLLMPTLSMRGSAIEFARRGTIFDPRTTPSQVGMLTEVFRRSSGVIRSIHPTHSVAVWGKDAAWWVENHYLAETPCGRGTPFFRLLERRGKIVFAGVDVSVMTFFHCIEELLEPLMAESPFTAECFVLKCNQEGKLIDTAPFRLYAPELSRRRSMRPLEIELRKKHRWRESRAGTLRVIALDAADVLRTAEEMAERGAYCYAPR